MRNCKLFIILIFATGLTSFTIIEGFLVNQKRYSLVRDAITEKEKLIINNLSNNDIKREDLKILITVFKEEGELNVYAKNDTEGHHKKITSYEIFSNSGSLGPKRRQGDLQVPEGFYHINRFNPMSSYHLSLGINYPNVSDRKKSKYSNLGGDIFIHGDCVTIGCMPMTDDKIKEIYLYSIFAKNNGQSKIPVYIFPFKMTDERIDKYKRMNESTDELINFWINIKKGHDQFHLKKNDLKFSINKIGDYVFN